MAVYAIARDEAHHVRSWFASCADADVVVLVDTGSTDETVQCAQQLGIVTHQIAVEPFRYDVARNRALDLVPAAIDVCLSLDLDEVLLPGWRSQLEEAWRTGATRVTCWLSWIWSDDYPPLRFTSDCRIHARNNYRWRFPVHEQLERVGSEAEVLAASSLEIQHLRDTRAARPHYLPLLRLRADEHPDDGATAHLLACEARLNGLWDEARCQERRALGLPLSPNERLHAMLMDAFLEPAAREDWLLAACKEFPERREPWCTLAQYHFDHQRWRACRAAAYVALRIQQPADDYLANPFAWGPWPDRLAALASRELGDDQLTVHHARRGLRSNPTDAELSTLLSAASERLIGGRPRVGASRLRRLAVTLLRQAHSAYRRESRRGPTTDGL